MREQRANFCADAEFVRFAKGKEVDDIVDGYA